MTKIIIIGISILFLSIGMAGAVEYEEMVRFRTAAVFIDSGQKHLAAWQVEVRYDKKQTAIVGLEGSRTIKMVVANEPVQRKPSPHRGLSAYPLPGFRSGGCLSL